MFLVDPATLTYFRSQKFEEMAQKNESPLSFKDPFGNIIILKKMLISLIGFITYRRFRKINKLSIEGEEFLRELPAQNVMFVSNHQTYFADVMALYHIFSNARSGSKPVRSPFYLLKPCHNAYYIAAEETMKNSGMLARIFSYAGAVTVKRAWRHKGKDVQRSSDYRAPAKIKKALSSGWVITFPQGTTAANAPVRQGASSIIKALNPIVVPVRISGFNKAFDKKGLAYRKRGTGLGVSFGKPTQFGKDRSAEEIHDFLENSLLDKKDEAPTTKPPVLLSS